MNIILLILIPILLVYEKKFKKDNTVIKREYLLSFVLYNLFVFLLFYMLGILDSGYHLVDDHEVYTIGKDLAQYGTGATLIKWLRKDLNIRFRFTYFIIRVLEVVAFGSNFKLWHIFYTFLAAVSLYLSYVFARKMKCPMWLSYIFSVLIFAGSQVAVLWRLGPQESLGTILLMAVFLCLLDYAKKKTTLRLIGLIILTILLGGIKEAFLVLLPLLPILLVFWEIREEGKAFEVKDIVRRFKNNWIYTLSTWMVFIIDMLIILFVVGTNKIGYAGIDSSFGLMNYIKQIWWSCTVAFRVYFFAILIGIVLIVIPLFVTLFKKKELFKQFEYLIFNVLIFLYFMGTQFILHAKSGMYERYMLPTTIGFCLFWIVDLYHLVKDKQRLKVGFSIFITVTMGAALIYTNIDDRAVKYADEGMNTGALIEKVVEYKEMNPDVVAVMEYELDHSASIYLQREHGIKSVYNVYYSGYSEGIVKDAYLEDEERQSILFEEADMYIGYPEKIEPLMEERNLSIAQYNRYDFGQFSMYASKEFDKYRKSLLIVGDSIGEGAGSSDPALKWYKKLVPYMKDNYGIDLGITNVSMGGNTSYAGYVRTMNLDEKTGYDYVVVCYGQNDAKEDFSLYYETLLRTIKEKYPSAVVIAILESSQREYTEKMQTIQELCEHYGVYVADAIAAFHNSGYSYEELCDDGTHPNDKGQEVYFSTVAEVLDQCYQETALDTVEDIEVVNRGIEEFKHYQYYSKKDFEKIDDLKYKLVIDDGELSGRLGIDYVTVKGNNWIKVCIQEGIIAEKDIVWDNAFTLRYIEVLSDDFYANEEVLLEFSSEEMFENFEGVIITDKLE